MRRDLERGPTTAGSLPASVVSRGDASPKGGQNSWSGAQVLMSVALVLFLGVAALQAYNLHSIHDTSSSEASVARMSRKFVGDFSNLPVDQLGDPGDGDARADAEEHAAILQSQAQAQAQARTEDIVTQLKDAHTERNSAKMPVAKKAAEEAIIGKEAATTTTTTATDADADADKPAIPAGCRTSIEKTEHGQHTVPPPAGPMNLVCCQTTKGVFNIAVHPSWAPVGAANFMSMVTGGFFDSRVPLFR